MVAAIVPGGQLEANGRLPTGRRSGCWAPFESSMVRLLLDVCLGQREREEDWPAGDESR
jgi:hypothetical protein